MLACTLWPNKEEDDECHSGSYRGLNRVTSGENLFIAWYVLWNFGCFFSVVYIHYFVFTYFHCSFWWPSEFICWTEISESSNVLLLLNFVFLETDVLMIMGLTFFSVGGFNQPDIYRWWIMASFATILEHH